MLLITSFDNFFSHLLDKPLQITYIMGEATSPPLIICFMMKKSIPREQLLYRCKEAMKKYEMSVTNIDTYMHRLYRLYDYMQTKDIPEYTEEVGEKYCDFLKSDANKEIRCIDRHFRVVNLLRLIVNNLPYTTRPDYKRPIRIFAGDIGKAAQTYLQERSSLRLSSITLDTNSRILSFFSVAMTNKGISLDNIKSDDIINYMSCIQKMRDATFAIIKNFFIYLYENKVIESNIAAYLTGLKRYRKEKIVSFYSQEEILKIESSIKRSTKEGKRIYAMVILASRLGLRASDITRLTFENIDWDKNEITLTQYKTKRLITLPLLAEVGSALIDYILYARPKTEGIKNVFITFAQPYRPCRMASFSQMVQNTVRKSGVSYQGRHTGAHCLRHSLATSLLAEGTKLPVISSVLGHESSESTMVYLGVNVKQLLQCSLDVPNVSDTFYKQKGGWFYE